MVWSLFSWSYLFCKQTCSWFYKNLMAGGIQHGKYLIFVNVKPNKRSEEHHWFVWNTSIIEDFFVLCYIITVVKYCIFSAWEFLSFWESLCVFKMQNPPVQAQLLQRCNFYSSNKIRRIIGTLSSSWLSWPVLKIGNNNIACTANSRE